MGDIAQQVHQGLTKKIEFLKARTVHNNLSNK